MTITVIQFLNYTGEQKTFVKLFKSDLNLMYFCVKTVFGISFFYQSQYDRLYISENKET